MKIFLKDRKQRSLALQPTYHIIPSVIIICFFGIYFLNTLNIYSMRMGQVILIALGAIGLLYTLGTTKRRANQLYLLFFLLYSICGLLSFIIVGNANVLEYLWPVGFGGAAIIMLNFYLYYKPVVILYHFICSIYMIAMIFNKTALYMTGDVSRNNISITILVFFSLFCIVSYTHNKRIHFMSAILGLVVSIWAVGRSGILTFSFIGICFLFLNFDGKKVKVKNPFKVIMLIAIIIAIGIMMYDSIIAPAIYNYNFKGIESGRTVIWGLYLKNMFSSVPNFIFGVPLDNEKIFFVVNGNLHNSFLNLHSRYGFLITMLFTGIILVKLVFFIKKTNLLYALLMTAIIFRISFDLSSFNGILDVIIFYFMFEGQYSKTLSTTLGVTAPDIHNSQNIVTKSSRKRLK